MQNPNFIKSLLNAFNGIKYFFANERNGKIQLCIGVLVVGCSFYFKCSTNETITIIICIGLVTGLEMLNTALEKLCDVVHQEYHPKIKIIKDVAAGAVLLVSIASVIIGCFIFLPKIF